MVVDNLIKSCSCGNTESFTPSHEHNIDLLICDACGTPHQYLPGWTPEKVTDFYKNMYHTDAQLSIGHQAYKDRYDHDFKVSNIRLDAYKEFIAPGMTGLDIGSSNSAFVHAAIERGIKCKGVEVGKDIGDTKVTIRKPIQDVTNIEDGSLDFATMHDVLEHIVDVRVVLTKLKSLIKVGGTLIVDIPDYFVEQGLHHWRPVQHLWFWNEHQLGQLLEEFKFNPVKITKPIPGKVVFYCRRVSE